jgi:hypothetical protein
MEINISKPFLLKSRTGSFEGCESRNFINHALYCSWIIPFNKGCYQTLFIPKIENIKLPVCDLNEKVWKFLWRHILIRISITE